MVRSRFPDASGPDPDLEDLPDLDIDPDRIGECGYWRCGELFEQRNTNHIFCRKACRSRQRKWERAQVRKQRRLAQRAAKSRRTT